MNLSSPYPTARKHCFCPDAKEQRFTRLIISVRRYEPNGKSECAIEEEEEEEEEEEKKKQRPASVK
jgi:hypothetical protein